MELWKSRESVVLTHMLSMNQISVSQIALQC